MSKRHPFLWLVASALLGAATSLMAAEAVPSTQTNTVKLPLLSAGQQVLAGGKVLSVGHTACPYAIDWNNDGKLDLLVGTFASGRVYLFLHQGTNDMPTFGKGVPLRAGRRELQVGYG